MTAKSTTASESYKVAAASTAAASDSFDMVAGAFPDRQLVYTNAVYANPEDKACFPTNPGLNYVQINDLAIFIVQPNAAVKKGEIALTMPQKAACKVTGTGDTVSVKVVAARAEQMRPLLDLQLQLDMVVQDKKTRAEISEDELVEYIKNHYANHVLMRGQTFAVDFLGMDRGIKLTVKECMVASKEAKEPTTKKEAGKRKLQTEFEQFGKLNDATYIAVSPSSAARESKFFIWHGSVSAAPVIVKPGFRFEDMGIGGLNQEFQEIFRRAFASRALPASAIARFGIKHVRGMLLYGPPGTGKTLIARQIGRMISGAEPTVVKGPEVLNSYVGGSEANIRKLFEPAEKEYKLKKEESKLHVIIFDEIDAICKARGSDRSGTHVHDTVVNQLLSIIDGVDSLNNILVIGMTNRLDMIDPALLRPGRLEVHVEIPLPNKEGRLQIFKIHTNKMREYGHLGADVDLDKLAELTKNFSGAEIEGVVKGAVSYCVYGNLDVTKDLHLTFDKDELKDAKVTMAHFVHAIEALPPAYGVAEVDLKLNIRSGIIEYGQEFAETNNTLKELVRRIKTSASTPLLTVLLEGAIGSGKTALACQAALDSGFPFVKLVSPDMFLDASERGKCSELTKVFEDAYKSELSLIILDNLERLLEYVAIGPRFSNAVLQCLSVLLQRLPPKKNRRLLVLATTRQLGVMKELGLEDAFNVILNVPSVEKAEHVKQVFHDLNISIDEKELDKIASDCPFPIGIRQLLMVLDMARDEQAALTHQRFMNCVRKLGMRQRIERGILLSDR